VSRTVTITSEGKANGIILASQYQMDNSFLAKGGIRGLKTPFLEFSPEKAFFVEYYKSLTTKYEGHEEKLTKLVLVKAGNGEKKFLQSNIL